MLKSLFLFISFIALLWFGPRNIAERTADVNLIIQQNEAAGTISVLRADNKEVVLTQIAKADLRPYIHPVTSPDGKSTMTEFSPAHHKHQTGIYWGFTSVNGRNYFTNPGAGYWQRVSARVLEKSGPVVKWQTVYNLLDDKGTVVMTETQYWAMQHEDGRFLLSLEWRGEAKTDVTIAKYPYGGLFVRMPWKQGIDGDVINAARQRNQKAEGQAATWVDVGMKLDGREDRAHIAILDHPENKGYPHKWRVDDQMGVGPVPTHDADRVIKKGENEVIKHRLVIYTGQFNDIKLNEEWGKYTGKDPIWASIELWNVAKREAMDAKFLTPDEALKAMTFKDGFTANVYAAEPDITQPMAFCWDDRGRLWVAENRDYESRFTGYANDGNSRILILEDTDHDGKADKKTVFADGIPFPAALAVGFDGVFVGAPPNLLYIPDRNHDDKADMADIEVRLTGWGIRDRHETLNSFHWGPDGWLYGCQGFATPSRIRKPEGKGKLFKHKDPFPEDEILKGPGVDINGGVWRYHPTKDKFEVVAHGLSNPWGIDYDAKGQIFITACVIPHLWYIIPGGIYLRQGGQHFNPYTYTDIQTITDHSHRSAHGGASIYQSDAYPIEQHGRIFMANIHEHAILTDILTPKGSGFVGSHGDDLMSANNAQWVGFSTTIGPDGDLYVLDWHDADICGGSVLNKETGRIYRVSPKQSLAKNFTGRYSDLNKMSDRQLVNLQTSPSDWHSRRARVILQNRAFKGKLKKNTQDELRRIYDENTNVDYRLRAFWALYVTNGLGIKDLEEAMDDKNEYIRGWAIQMAWESGAVQASTIARFEHLALMDPSPVVRLYLAAALQRIDADKRWNIAASLSQCEGDENDHNLPKMLWYGIEPLVAKDADRALSLAANSKLSIIKKFTARRAVDADAINTLVTWFGKQPKADIVMLEGTRDALEGRTDLKTPSNWKDTYTRLQRQNDKVKQLSTEIAQYFGDTEAANQFFATMRDKTAPADKRRKALLALSAQQRPELIKELPGLLSDDVLRNDAIRAIASFEDEKLGQHLLSMYPKLNQKDKDDAIQTLASRPKYGWILTQAIKNKTIEKRDIPAGTARQLRRVVGSGFVEIWGPIDQLPSNEIAYKKYRELLTPKALENADLKKGHEIFLRTCGACHKMYGEGGTIGPDLTGSNRQKVDYLLFNVLEPSGEIQDDYKLVVITTRDGRTYSGNIAAENERQVTMRIVGQEAAVINKSNIQSREVMPISMMPTGLFQNLSDKEVIDIVGYLSKTK
ncbi:dehydrogenase [Mucilaginibacter hurinus]|uniref:Dehydrogenase n=1 Tax=Mucilaginibacter hurinus TaxID=2201324 RepID=A0A367GTQ5_9SPHI|nr:PVC-type heme-binding CxxCH protein [Mucilaginibacter hurinus]RCH56455.1 dehydrogenase [Mucilaginibacter hurinus]